MVEAISSVNQDGALAIKIMNLPANVDMQKLNDKMMTFRQTFAQVDAVERIHAEAGIEQGAKAVIALRMMANAHIEDASQCQFAKAAMVNGGVAVAGFGIAEFADNSTPET